MANNLNSMNQAADPMVKAVRQQIAAFDLINTDPEREGREVGDHPAWRKIEAAVSTPE